MFESEDFYRPVSSSAHSILITEQYNENHSILETTLILLRGVYDLILSVISD